MRAFELLDDPHEAHVQALNGRLASVWTAVPGIIQSFNVAQQTVVVQPAVRAIRFDIDGVPTDVDLPLLLDCPVQFPAGGGFTLTFPVAKDDECLVVFASRCIDAWWQSGGVQNQAVMRMHDLSDGFALLGFSSVPRVIGSISTTATQLRSNDGATYVEVGAGEVTVKGATTTVNAITATVNASGSATVSSPSIILKNAGTALKNLLNSAFSIWAQNHVHTDPQGGLTSTPTTVPGTDTQTSVVQAE